MSLKEMFIAYYTLLRREVVRFMRIWTQTLFPPVVTQSLYFLIFGKFIGSQINDINGVKYMGFIIPGLVMMSVINNSFQNVVSSFFGNKFQRSIEELLVSPTPNFVIIAGYVSGGIIRGMLVGSLVFCVSMFFIRFDIYNYFIVAVFVFLTSVVFALGGLVNAIFAKKFDDISIFPNFVLIPLVYLGGVFYSIDSLPPIWQSISKLNPVLYMVNGFRYGFHGFSDVNLMFSFGILLTFVCVLLSINLYLLKKGIGLKT